MEIGERRVLMHLSSRDNRRPEVESERIAEDKRTEAGK